MATVYRTSEGDVLDLICLKYYGTVEAVTQVLSANPNLSEHGAVLPSGIQINLPELVIKNKESVSLWD